MVYNLTNITASNDLYNIMYHTNISSGYFLFGGMMLILFLTIVIVFKKQSFKKAFLAASFFTSLVGVYGFVMGWINVSLLILPILCLGAGLMILLFIDKT